MTRFFMGFLWLGITLALCIGASSASVFAEEKPYSGLVTIQKINKAEGAQQVIEVKGKKGTLQVTLSNETVIDLHSLISLKDVEPGSTIHVLAKKQAEQHGSGGARYPPMLVQIHAVVTGSLKPPFVPEKLQEQGLIWVSGTLKQVENGRERDVDGYRLGTSLGTEVLKVERVKSSKLKKRMKVFISGYLDESDRKNKTLDAVELISMAQRWKKYPSTHDFSKRTPKPRKKKKDDSKEDDDLPF